jgi:hypothetical protein
MSEYSPVQIWGILSGESEDIDELIDVQLGLKRLPSEQAVFITQLSLGYTAKQAMQTAGLTGNATRMKRTVLQRLAREING